MRGSYLKTLAIGTVLAAFAGHLTTANAQRTILVPVNHSWKYMVPVGADTAFCLNGSGWETVAFDDTAWPSGPGGFTGNETTAATVTSLAGLLNTTTLPAPTPSMGRPQYFRTHFNIASIVALSLTFSNRFDDQAVIYINGTRVGDYRHPTNPEDCVPGGTGGDEATAWTMIALTEAQLAGIVHDGDNVLAVSVHQNAVGSSDMVMVCSLSGDVASPPINQTPTEPADVTIGQCTTLTLTGSFTGSPTPTYQWLYEGSPVDGVANPSALTPTLTIANATAGNSGHYQLHALNANGSTDSREATVTVVADVTPPHLVSVVALASNASYFLITFDEPVDGTGFDTFICKFFVRDNSANLGDTVQGIQASPNTLLVEAGAARVAGMNYKMTLDAGAINDSCGGNAIVAVTANVSTEVLLADRDSATDLWSYDESGNDLGTAWREMDYDASAWPTGPGCFGLETAGNVQGTIRTPWTVSTKITYYLRKSVIFPSAQVDSLTLIQQADDGCITYINGNELQRYGLAAGMPVAFDTLFASPAEPQPVITTTLPLASVIAGRNVIAVEVHQSSTTSSDIFYNSRLIAICSTIYPSLQVSQSGSTLTVSWGEAGVPVQVQTSSDLVTWANDTRTPAHVGGTYSLTYTVPAGAGHLFVRLLP